MKVEVFEPQEARKPEEPKPVKSYPYIGKYKGGLVLFYKPKTGVRIKEMPAYGVCADNENAIGHHYAHCHEDAYTPLPKGTIIKITILQIGGMMPKRTIGGAKPGFQMAQAPEARSQQEEMNELECNIDKLEAENAQLRETLRPFADVVKHFIELIDFRCFADTDCQRAQYRKTAGLIVEDFLGAAEALKKKKG